MTLAQPSIASAHERTFVRLDRICVADPTQGRNVWFSAQGPEYYLEVVGTTAGSRMELCERNLLVLWNCRKFNIYRFSIVCRGGRITAPEFYIAYFAQDSGVRRLEPRLTGNQLSIIQSQYVIRNPIGPTPEPKRYYYPAGYAPIHRDTVDDILVRIPWDEAKGRPSIDFELTREQDRELTAMFRTRGGDIEPFPAAHLAKLAEWRAVATAVLPVLARLPFVAQIGVLAAVFAAGAFVNWLLSRALPKTAIPQRAVVFASISIAAYLLVYWLGLPDGVTLVAISILGGFLGLVIGLFG